MTVCKNFIVAGAEALARALREHSCQLTNLNLAYNGQLDDTGGAFTACMRVAGSRCSRRHSASAVRFVLMQPPASPSGGAGIALALALLENAAHSRLHTLSLDDCDLGDAAAAAFGAALTAQGTFASSPAGGGTAGGGGLRRLGLSGNDEIGHAGAFALAGGIRSAGAWLSSVAVSRTRVGREGGGAALLRAAEETWVLRHGRKPGFRPIILV